MRWALGLLLCGVLAAPAGAQGFDIHSLLAEKYAEMSLSPPATARVVICHGFGCRSRTEIGLGKADHARLAQLMASGRASPAAERRAIARAVAWFARRVAPEAGTTKAVARANMKFIGGDPGQFDCVDTSTNTTTVFYVMDQLRLFRHHQLALPVSRRFIIDGAPHITAVLTERRTGQPWAFDPWPHNNGELPDVLPVESWLSHN
jgi:hypothetical protein